MNWILIILAANFYVIVVYTDNVSFSTVVPTDDENNTAGGPVDDIFPTNGNTSYGDVRCTTTADVDAAMRSLCPAQCRCSPVIYYKEALNILNVDCSGVEFNDSASLSHLGDKLELLLSRCTSELAQLNIANTPLTGIRPQSSVCNLSKMRSLNLGRNHFRSLPANCFTNMPNLTVFWADHNDIQYLQVTNSVEE